MVWKSNHHPVETRAKTQSSFSYAKLKVRHTLFCVKPVFELHFLEECRICKFSLVWTWGHTIGCTLWPCRPMKCVRNVTSGRWRSPRPNCDPPTKGRRFFSLVLHVGTSSHWTVRHMQPRCPHGKLDFDRIDNAFIVSFQQLLLWAH